jgi:hypothetical protein
VLATGILTLVVVAASLLGQAALAGIVLGLAAALYVFRRVVFSWTTLLVAPVLVLMLVPLTRFTVRPPLSVQPLVLVVLVGAALVGFAFATDRRFTWQRSPLAWAVSTFIIAQFASIVVNIESLYEGGFLFNVLREMVLYTVTVFLLFFLVRQLIRSERTLHLLIGLVVVVGAVIGVLSLVERATGFNVFYTLGYYLPLSGSSDFVSFSRDGEARAAGPTAHPIELGVLLPLLLPLAVWQIAHASWPAVARVRIVFWSAMTVLILAGTLAAVSRTSIVMILLMVAVTCVLRPKLIPAVLGSLAVAVVGILLFMPDVFSGTLGSLFDVDTLVKSQTQAAGMSGSGRLLDVDGSLERIAQNPWFGTGLGSRLVSGSTRNAQILDDQYLTTGETSGLVGVLGIAVLIGVPLWRLGRMAVVGRAVAVGRAVGVGAPAVGRAVGVGVPAAVSPAAGVPAAGAVSSRYRDLALALAGAIVAYAVAILLFDGFAFKQSLGVFVVMLAIGSWVLAEAPGQSGRAPALVE